MPRVSDLKPRLSYRLICGDCSVVMSRLEPADTIFADPPDNLGTAYESYVDKLPERDYLRQLDHWLQVFINRAQTVWLSYNARWTYAVGSIVSKLLEMQSGNLEAKPCVQVFTFGQHNQNDLANGHRPLLRLRWKEAPLFPDAIRVASWRQENGDKRADPRGRVPCDIFDFPRVTGNSGQRRTWHPTQSHEGLVERCLKLTTPPGGKVLDPFAGTGTVQRVCKRLGFACASIEIDPGYCRSIAEENKLSCEP